MPLLGSNNVEEDGGGGDGEDDDELFVSMILMMRTRNLCGHEDNQSINQSCFQIVVV